jgi:hypothetical protein
MYLNPREFLKASSLNGSGQFPSFIAECSPNLISVMNMLLGIIFMELSCLH